MAEHDRQAWGSRVPPWGAAPEELVDWVKVRSWEDWESAYRAWWRLVEENVRMLAGRHFDVFIEALGDFVDLRSWLRSADDLWREYPTFGWVSHYYKLTLSKLTENVPAIGYLPSSADERDARLARIMEPLFKHLWNHSLHLPEQMFRLYGWVIAGCALLILCVCLIAGAVFFLREPLLGLLR